MNRRGGFTLIETVIALGVFMLVTLSVVNLAAYTSAAMDRISVNAELLENARIAVDMMSVYVRAAKEVNIRTDSNGLRLMTVKLAASTHEFRYNSLLSPSDTKYHRLEFGGNELASYIARVGVALEGDILTLSVTTDDQAGSEAVTEPVSLTVKIKLYNTVTVS